MRLANKIAVITGAGAGIGEAIAIRFAEEGAKLILADYNLATASAVAAKLKDAVAVQADISIPEQAKSITEAAIQHFGGLDIVVNNAADFTTKNIEDATFEDWHRVLGVNVIGAAMVNKYAVPEVKKRGGGAIVNIASMSAIIAQPDFVTYNTSKGAILLMTRCMALDLAPFKIRVNSVCPGAIFTTADRARMDPHGTNERRVGGSNRTGSYDEPNWPTC